MLCWKKGSYSPTDKQKSHTKENKKELVTSKRNNRLKSFQKKSSKDKKDSLTNYIHWQFKTKTIRCPG